MLTTKNDTYASTHRQDFPETCCSPGDHVPSLEQRGKTMRKLIPPSTNHRDPTQLEWTDVRVESCLGNGSFSNIFKVTIDKLSESQKSNDDERGLTTTPSTLATTTTTTTTSYALKCLNVETICCSNSFVCGAVDLALEAMILSSLQHENIIQIHGMKAGSGADSFSTGGTNFFIVLDLLTGTLDQRIECWKKEEGANSSWSMSKKRKQRLDRLNHRLDDVMMGIVKGMNYLHNHNIMHRDLKPQNIGFDQRGTVRIFDFGLAREVKEDDSGCDHSKTRTEVAGTLRYMPPETYLRKESGLPGDVYSFAIILWEVCTLKKPYEEIKVVSDFKRKVMLEGYRPSLDSICSPTLQNLLRTCWVAFPSDRSTFSDIETTLQIVTYKNFINHEMDEIMSPIIFFRKLMENMSCTNVPKLKAKLTNGGCHSETSFVSDSESSFFFVDPVATNRRRRRRIQNLSVL